MEEAATTIFSSIFRRNPTNLLLLCHRQLRRCHLQILQFLVLFLNQDLLQTHKDPTFYEKKRQEILDLRWVGDACGNMDLCQWSQHQVHHQRFLRVATQRLASQIGEFGSQIWIFVTDMLFGRLMGWPVGGKVDEAKAHLKTAFGRKNVWVLQLRKKNPCEETWLFLPTMAADTLILPTMVVFELIKGSCSFSFFGRV